MKKPCNQLQLVPRKAPEKLLIFNSRPKMNLAEYLIYFQLVLPLSVHHVFIFPLAVISKHHNFSIAQY